MDEKEQPDVVKVATDVLIPRLWWLFVLWGILVMLGVLVQYVAFRRLEHQLLVSTIFWLVILVGVAVVKQIAIRREIAKHNLTLGAFLRYFLGRRYIFSAVLPALIGVIVTVCLVNMQLSDCVWGLWLIVLAAIILLYHCGYFGLKSFVPLGIYLLVLGIASVVIWRGHPYIVAAAGFGAPFLVFGLYLRSHGAEEPGEGASLSQDSSPREEK